MENTHRLDYYTVVGKLKMIRAERSLLNMLKVKTTAAVTPFISIK